MCRGTLISLAIGCVCMGTLEADDLWVHYDGKEGPGHGKHIVFVTGDDEYRSEEGMPMLAKILSVRHGFKCTVLFAIEPSSATIKPDFQTNIPGTEVLRDADLMVLFTRFRALPDEQMQPIIDFANSGKPMIGLRTSTHAFNYDKKPDSKFARYGWRSKDPPGGFGQAVFGDTWVSHHGRHGKQSARGIVNAAEADHPILRGVEDVWGASDVYGIKRLLKTDRILLHGQVLEGMKPEDKPLEGPKNDPMMPLAWIRDYVGETGNSSRVFCTTMGASVDLESEGLRRLVVNACYWGLGMEDAISASTNVDYVGEYKPTMFGFNVYQRGLKPSDFK